LSNNFALRLRVRGEVSVDRMSAALRQIRVRHPALIPDGSANGGIFPLSVKSDCGDDDWLAAAQAAMREPFPERSGPFARFVMLQYSHAPSATSPSRDFAGQGFDLVASFDHSVCDGISGMYVLRDLLKALADPQATLVAMPVPGQTGALIPPAVLANRGLQRRLSLTAAGLRAQVLLAKWRRRLAPARPAGASSSPAPSAGELPLSGQYIILPARLSAAQTTGLLARCKKEQVSVHAAVCTAWLSALAGPSARSGIVSSPVNLRGRLSPPPSETAGLFLTTVETSLKCVPGQDFWDLAREFKAKFARDTRDEALFFKPLLYNKIFSQTAPTDRGLLVELLFNSPVAYDFSITNLGRLVLPERSGGLRVEAFNGPLVNSSEYERTVGVSTLGGQMSFSYMFRKSQTDPAAAGELMQRALVLLTQAAG